MHLDRDIVGGQSPFGRPCLCDRGQQSQQHLRLFAARRRVVRQAGAIKHQRQRALGIALGRQQHVLDVGMLDNRRGVRTGVSCRTPLHAFLRVTKSQAIAAISKRRGTESHPNARLVHHPEHLWQALPRFTDEPSDRARRAIRTMSSLAQIQQAVRRAPIAHLVVEPRDSDIVSCPAGQDLRHDEQRNAARARDQPSVRIGHFRQHKMDNVFGQIVVSAGNPHLVSGQPVPRTEFVVAVRHGARRNVRQVRSRLGFRQTHRSEPFARNLWDGEFGDLCFRPECGDQPRIGRRQHGISGGRDIGAQELRERRIRQKARKAHPADLWRKTRGKQPEFGILAKGIANCRQSMNTILVQIRLFAIRRLVVRKERVRRQLFGQVENSLGHRTIDRIVRRSCQHIVQLEPVPQQEVQLVA